MKRRELIKMISLSTGAVLSIPLSNSLLIACKKVEPVKKSVFTPRFFNQQEFLFVQDLLDIILPKTDSPSANEVGVDQIIDTMIGTVYSPDQQEAFNTKFTALTKYMSDKNKSVAIQELIISDAENDKMAKNALIDLKQQAVAYYLTTKEVATNYLNYLPVPGAYQACISLESVGGKAWAL
ncbi:gluconate 2-dehydrogenase subunit 3 family protein [Lutimonas zeaxanthinifaciens]|uniref:gluconate 2-dehydrogenase subunit 3 family protein n=1 Tax=Lutimonas zeaxanthinifaciens TaxID=3060215 RepID=UPI00265CF111|nr:gluconate 2-dehydrogenase subunit 3 family protein [Lutimonas sp. YSD2104]WKK67104.1 gluconate 2-dehydrogenase subunit 3 family protein [Lutimonas sp. YSD2104]